MTYDLTQNPDIRNTMLRAAVVAAVNDGAADNLLPSVQLQLPPDFDATAEECAAMFSELYPPEQTEAGDVPALHAVIAEPETVEINTAPAMTVVECNDRLTKLQTELHQARGEMNTLATKRIAAREKLAHAILAFQSGFIPRTQAQLIRDHIRSEQERRAAMAAGRVSGRRGRSHGASAIDQQAAYSRGGSANVGYGRNWIKKARSLVNAPKVPSER